tara:strand:+ start:312 stop:782 length:471 start_codon:yes stop_codon:yes gene_type:complete
MKIDIEGYDQEVLKELWSCKIYPEYISAEIHTQDVVDMQLKNRLYRGFKVVVGRDAESQYRNAQIATTNEGETYSFPRHAAGLFGEDIDGQWFDRRSVHRHLTKTGIGWKDLHAWRLDDGKYVEVHCELSEWRRLTKHHIERILPGPILKFLRRLL